MYQHYKKYLFTGFLFLQYILLPQLPENVCLRTRFYYSLCLKYGKTDFTGKKLWLMKIFTVLITLDSGLLCKKIHFLQSCLTVLLSDWLTD